jgi:uncharacterized protein
MSAAVFAPFAHPLYILLKPAGSACNLRCTYCYYLDKKDLYPQGGNFQMDDSLLEEFTKQYIQSQTMSEILFTWHGGETLLRNIPFYKKALHFQQKYAEGRNVSNCIQTNGTLLTEEWCRFLKENHFLVGISVDGPEHCHDRYRLSAQGKPSFGAVMKGLDLLQKHDIEYNIMGVVNDYNAGYPQEFYRFFKTKNCRYIQFSPVVERQNGEVTPWSVSPEKWGDFLIAVFNEWVKGDIGRFFVSCFDAALAAWMGLEPGICIFAKTCGHAGVMEFNGDVYSCDHFVSPAYQLGNIRRQTLTEMMYSDRQQQFGKNKYSALPAQCLACKYLFACNGECPKNRRTNGVNYLCKGYYKFFRHIEPYMEQMVKTMNNIEELDQ